MISITFSLVAHWLPVAAAAAAFILQVRILFMVATGKISGYQKIKKISYDDCVFFAFSFIIFSFAIFRKLWARTNPGLIFIAALKSS